MQYNGNGYEFYLESGEKITLTERDLINLRLEMNEERKVENSTMFSVMEQARSESPNTSKKKRGKG